MAVYNVTNQAVSTLDSRLADVKASLETRRALWAALPQTKRDVWKVTCPDPILDRLWKLYVWLKEFFGEA